MYTTMLFVTMIGKLDCEDNNSVDFAKDTR